MRPDFADHDLDAELVFDRFLGGDDLSTIQEVLIAVAPRWCHKLRVWKSPRKQILIDVSQPDALAAAALAGAGERGDTFRKLVEQYGEPALDRFFGSVELRGDGPALTVVISVDQVVLSPLGSKRDLGNQVSLQVRRNKVEGRVGSEWLVETFMALCEALSPAWGAAWHPSEYWSKVMSDEPPVQPLGRDFGRFLPGVFWINFFGRPYVELVGERRLRSAPNAQAVDDGVLVSVAGQPLEWDNPASASLERQVRDHLGPDLFFNKGEPDRLGVVPNWS